VADARYFLERALSVEPWNRDVREALQKLKEIEAAPVPAVPRKSADELYQDALELAGADKLDDARNLLELLLRGNPQHALAHNDLGVICYRLGDVAGAERHYQQAAQLEPACANYQKNLADLYFTELGKADDAIHIYLDLQKKYPRDVEVLLNLGHICTAVGHGEEAKSFYRRALEIEPWNSDARSALQAPMQSPGKAL
jgi:Flp pilus assembly protein TadD